MSFGDEDLAYADEDVMLAAGSEQEGDDEQVKLFIGQVPRDMDEDALRPIFEAFGPIVELSVIREKTNGTHRGCAFLTYATRAAADVAVVELHNKHKLPNVRASRAQASMHAHLSSYGVSPTRGVPLAGAERSAGQAGRRQINR